LIGSPLFSGPIHPNTRVGALHFLLEPRCTHRSCDVVNNTWNCVVIWRKHFIGRVGVKLSPKTLSSGEKAYPHHLKLTKLEIHHVAGGPIGGKANDVEISHSHIYDNGVIASASGTYVYGSRYLIKNNRIHDNNSDGIRTGSDPVGTELADSIIENNVTYNQNRPHIQYANTDVYAMRMGGEGIIVWHGYNNIIRNNISYANVSFGIRLNGVPPNNNRVYNNTSYHNGRQGIFIHADEPNLCPKQYFL
jgi:hypothetical protein